MIPLFKVFMAPSVGVHVEEILHGGYITQGKKVEEFEARLVDYIGANGLINTVNSCTSALQLAVYLAGGTGGDLVISTPMTCSATNTAIKAMGGQIIWADIDPKTGNIDPASVNKLLLRYPRVRAIVAVHWAGYPCEIDALNDMGEHFSVPVIEDAAHAFGASYKGDRIGSHCDFVCFSFQAIKHLTTVDGGALVCRDTETYKRGKLLRWYGIDRESERKDFRCEEDVREWGYKFHMNDVAATIGLHQLRFVGDVIQRHRENGAYYRERFKDLNGLTLLDYSLDRESSYWLFTVRVKERQRFMEEMKKAGIVVSQVHARNDLHTMFSEFRRNQPGLNEFAAEHVSIPVGWWLTGEQRS